MFTHTSHKNLSSETSNLPQNNVEELVNSDIVPCISSQEGIEVNLLYHRANQPTLKITQIEGNSPMEAFEYNVQENYQ